MMKSFSCRPLIFFVRSDIVAAPAETDVWVVAFGLGERRGAFDKGEGLGEILEAVGPLDAGRLVEQSPFRRLPSVFLGGVAAQRRDAAATRRAAFFNERRSSRSSVRKSRQSVALLDLIGATVP